MWRWAACLIVLSLGLKPVVCFAQDESPSLILSGVSVVDVARGQVRQQNGVAGRETEEEGRLTRGVDDVIKRSLEVTPKGRDESGPAGRLKRI